MATTVSYATRLIPLSPEKSGDSASLFRMMRWEKTVFNHCSEVQFKLGLSKLSITTLHHKVYYPFRKANPEIPSQVVIRGEQACLANYKAVRSNGHSIVKPILKKKLSVQLDKRLYSCLKKDEEGTIRITTADGRKLFKLQMYPRLAEYLEKYEFGDPTIYEKDHELWISFPFLTGVPVAEQPTLCLGVDLGIRVPAACSDGRLIIDKKFNAEKRRLRYLKRQLQSKGTKSSRKHLSRLRNKERNKNKNQTFHLANAILKTKADAIALENLEGLKASRKKKENKSQNRISQVPFYELRRVLTYKAESLGKQVILVNPAYTSQTDSATGKRKGERRGRRFVTVPTKKGRKSLVYDADINAAVNIGIRSKLPVSHPGNRLLDGQAVVVSPHSSEKRRRVNRPNPTTACESRSGNVCKPRHRASITSSRL
jgi:IS605 OrfB family transposase